MTQAINKVGWTYSPNNQPNTNIQLPTTQRNHTLFDQKKVDYFVSQKEQALPYLKQVLQTSQDEKQIVEALYIVDRLIDNKTKGIPAMYPVFARFNNTDSPNIQTFLAGVYRKTQVPDAFGPLVAMLIRNSTKEQEAWKLGSLEARLKPSVDNSSQLTVHSSLRNTLQSSNPPTLPFDPNEEIGGAILKYIETYSKGAPKIDYSA